MRLGGIHRPRGPLRRLDTSRRGEVTIAPIVADHPGQQIQQCLERRPIDLRTLLSTNRRASQPVEHPQWQLQRKTGRAAGQATAGYGNATFGNDLIYADIPPRPGVKLVENPALTGTVGVRESSYTTRSDHIAHWATNRRHRRRLTRLPCQQQLRNNEHKFSL